MPHISHDRCHTRKLHQLSEHSLRVVSDCRSFVSSCGAAAGLPPPVMRTAGDGGRVALSRACESASWAGGSRTSAGLTPTSPFASEGGDSRCVEMLHAASTPPCTVAEATSWRPPLLQLPQGAHTAASLIAAAAFTAAPEAGLPAAVADYSPDKRSSDTSPFFDDDDFHNVGAVTDDWVAAGAAQGPVSAARLMRIAPSRRVLDWGDDSSAEAAATAVHGLVNLAASRESIGSPTADLEFSTRSLDRLPTSTAACDDTNSDDLWPNAAPLTPFQIGEIEEMPGVAGVRIFGEREVSVGFNLRHGRVAIAELLLAHRNAARAHVVTIAGARVVACAPDAGNRPFAVVCELAAQHVVRHCNDNELEGLNIQIASAMLVAPLPTASENHDQFVSFVRAARRALASFLDAR